MLYFNGDNHDALGMPMVEHPIQGEYSVHLSVLGIILTLFMLLFGENLYQQFSGRSIADDFRNFFIIATELPTAISSTTPSHVEPFTKTPSPPTATPSKSTLSYGH